MTPEELTEFQEAINGVSTIFNVMLDGVLTVRTRAVEAGVSDEVADQIASTYLVMLMEMMSTAIKNTSKEES